MPQATPAWFFFGDSLTQGVNDCLMPGGWVSRLAVLAHEAGLCPIPRATFYNLGARRHSTANIASRWRQEMETRLIPGLEPRLVFCVGVVDMVVPGGGTPAEPARSAEQLQTVLDQAATAAPTLVISPPPVAEPQANARIAHLCALQKKLCAQRDIPYAQVHELLITNTVYMDDLKDGLHPGPQGCAQMAQTLMTLECVRAFMLAPQ